jgi:hypothetical protein
MYTFEEQLREGVQGEHALDAFFAPDWIITPDTSGEQRRGIDRHYQHRHNGETLTIEYKTDYVAEDTHNAFLETVSVDTPPPKLGWVFTCQAEVLFYYVPGDGLVYVLRPVILRDYVNHLAHYRKPVPVHNHGYPVPLRVLERLAFEIVSV